jgi:hypothetical protein
MTHRLVGLGIGFFAPSCAVFLKANSHTELLSHQIPDRLSDGEMIELGFEKRQVRLPPL